ncbi:NYN domain-containing protein [Maritimibacter alexandrii]|uniref:NYN domain-containing protein n=1 Tax=Maritimibacter alexandrii TaxID=2570355 RepID=UPI001109BB10|nr:hypothetical protein [Maritimibacter alexandrii]
MSPLAIGVFVLGLLIGALVLRVRRSRRPAVLVDGSNVMYWRGETPDIRTVRQVVKRLEADGFRPGVMFDANAGYLLFGHYTLDRAFAKHLNLPEKRVMVVPKGTQADGHLLRAAADMNARIVTNDRFRDWGDRYPLVTEKGRLIRGGYRGNRLHLKT